MAPSSSRSSSVSLLCHSYVEPVSGSKRFRWIWQGDASRVGGELYTSCVSALADGNSAERSSLLQVSISISGLVLVRNPHHCEPAYAKLDGQAVSIRMLSRHACQFKLIDQTLLLRDSLRPIERIRETSSSMAASRFRE
jgi:hypothetical protein